jgi:pimeloyl-ACP methyl ester carboxylesterase
VAAISRLGEPLLQANFIGADFLAAVPGLFSDEVEVSTAALQDFLRLCVHEQPSLEDSYFLLGYNAIVPPHVRLALFSRNLNNDSVVATMRKPMLLSYGEQDVIVSPTMGRHIAGIASHARLSTYPNVGHAPFWEAPERCNRELREFCESV